MKTHFGGIYEQSKQVLAKFKDKLHLSLTNFIRVTRKETLHSQARLETFFFLFFWQPKMKGDIKHNDNVSRNDDDDDDRSEAIALI